MDRQRLADALAYEQERRRRLANVVPMPASGQPEVAPTPSLRSNLENLSIGLGEGLTNQLEGVRALVTDPIGSAKGAYEGVVAAVRDPSIIADALRYTAQQAASGPLGAGEVIGEMVGPMRTRGTPVMQEIDVYHGSPHRFPPTENNPLGEFDASKIGTGEGAQAYGHGSYLAESPDVARDYQVRLSYDPEKMKIGGKQINVVYNQLQDAAARMPPARAAAEYEKLDLIERLMMNNPVDEVEKAAAELSPATQKWFATQVKPSFETYGSFYKADLPDEMVDRMLDWDKPLKEQPANVQKFFSVIYKPDDYLTDWLRQGDPEDIAKILQEEGIPGIKYADAGSRGQGGSGTRNFVVFPGEEKNVRILERK